MGRVIHFEITADDTARAQKFYQQVFDWEVADSQMPGLEYLLVTTGPEGEAGINGAIMPRAYHDQPMINTVAVDDLDQAMKQVTTAGGKLEGDKQNIPGVGDFHYARDTEGNLLGLLQQVESAK